MFALLLRHRRGAEVLRRVCSCVCVCLSVCLSAARISQDPHAPSLPIFVHVAYGRGSVLLRRRWDTLYTSGFVSDIMFFYNGLYSAMDFAFIFYLLLADEITMFITTIQTKHLCRQLCICFLQFLNVSVKRLLQHAALNCRKMFTLNDDLR